MLGDLSQRTIQKKRWLWFSEILVIKSNLNGTKNNCLSEQISGYTRILPDFSFGLHHFIMICNNLIFLNHMILMAKVGFGRKLMDHLSGGIELFP